MLTPRLCFIWEMRLLQSKSRRCGFIGAPKCRAEVPLVFGGNTGKPEVIELKPPGDDGLYLKYQENLVRTLAYCFGLKPQDFGIERDVNRSTASFGREASVEEARLPIASLLQSKLNIRVLPRIAQLSGDEKINDLEFFYLDIDPKDRKTTADIDDIYLKRDAVFIDEVRRSQNKPPLPFGLGALTATALQALLAEDPMALIDGLKADSSLS